jgi:hypothetical protein
MSRWLVVLLTGLLMLLSLLTGCDLLESDVATVADIEAFIGVDLPADATNLYYEVGGFQDTIIWLRFDTSPESRAAYLDALGFDEPLTEANRPLMSPAGDDLPWWDVETVVGGVGGSYDNFDANLHFQILVSPIDTTHERVYLIVFNT